tara:strand:+ start:132 stop:425 length:294 start_codon:yes stop_codon:yes gene_type:complete
MRELIPRKDAISNNLKYYFTGVACVNGHIAERNTKWCDCVECKKGTSAKQYKENPEKCKKSTRELYLKTNGAAQKKYSIKRAQLNKANKVRGDSDGS